MYIGLSSQPFFFLFFSQKNLIINITLHASSDVIVLNLIFPLVISGCPVLLCSESQFQDDRFECLNETKRLDICHSLFYCINWFRELVKRGYRRQPFFHLL